MLQHKKTVPSRASVVVRQATALVCTFASVVGAAPVVASMSVGQSVGGEFRVNTTTAGDQDYPAVSMNASGGFVVSWESQDADGNWDIYMQRYAADGKPLGGGARVNTAVAGNQRFPEMAMDAEGNFVVVWVGTDGPYPYNEGIYGQRFSSNGVPQGEEFRVNTTIDNAQISPSVAMAADGSFAVVWESYAQGGNGWGMYGQRYASGGTPIGGEFRIRAQNALDYFFPKIAMGARGDFVVTWTHLDGPCCTPRGVFAQRYAVDGTPQGSEFRVNTTTANDQQMPSAAVDAHGNFVIVWQSAGQDGSGWGVYGQRYAANGTAQGNEFLINTTTLAGQFSPIVSMSAVGDFVVTWQSATQNSSLVSVRARRFAADGAPQGHEFAVNSTATSNYKVPVVAMDADGESVVAWGSYGPDGSGYGVFARRFSGGEAVDLALIKVDSSDLVVPGALFSYTLSISNNHAVVAPTGVPAIDSAIGTANTITVVDSLPSGMAFRAASGAGWTCDYSSGTVTCDYTGTLLPMTTSSLTVDVAAPNDEGTIANVASLSAAQYDAASSNNTDSETTSICENAGTLTFSAVQYAVTEGGAVGIQVTRSGGSCRPVSVVYFASSGSAQTGEDFTAKSGTLSWAHGESGSKSVVVTTLQDGLDEDTETVSLALSSPTGGAEIGTPGAAVLNINDDDPAPIVSITTADGAVTEDASASVTVQLSAASGRAITVPFTLGGTAASGDYTVTASPVTIPAGTTSMMLATISSTDDALDEDVETVSVSLGTPTNASAGSNSSYVLSINDNDAPPMVSVSTEDASMTEASSTRSARVELSAPSAREISVGFNLSGSAALGSDYTSTASPITIPPGTTSATLSTISVQNDQLDEYDETIVVTLGSLVNVTAGADTDYTLTVTDDDPTPTVGFTAAAQTVNEGAGSATVTAQASAVSGRTIQIPFTRSGSATSPADYSVSASQIVIPAGSQSGSVTVNLMDDKNIELSEQAVFTMGTPVNATAGATTSHTLTIKDNDPIALP